MKDLLNNMRNANYYFWTALLTINGILFSVFSIAVISNLFNSDFVYSLLVLNLISILLLLLNFRAIKLFYYNMGKYTKEQVLGFTEEEKNKELDIASKHHKWTKVRDVSVWIIFFIEILLIIYIIWKTKSEMG